MDVDMDIEDLNPYHKPAQPIDDSFFDEDPSKPAIPFSLKKAPKSKLDLLQVYTNYVVSELDKIDHPTGLDYNQIFHKASGKFKTTFKKTELYYEYSMHHNINPIYRGFMQTKSMRSDSGVIVFAIFTHPMWKDNLGKFKSFSCEFDCKYCPQQPNRPRSYVDGEPGNDRAVSVNYDTVKQIYYRAQTYKANAHIVDKAEVIILGGTFHSYDSKYLDTFFTNMYFGFNTINSDRSRPVLSLEEEMEINSSSSSNSVCKVIGLTIETRPDQINAKNIIDLRRYGVTRVQLGIQHTNDRILTRVNRGCNSKDSIRAILNLKRSGFKVDIHLMPDLPLPYTLEFETLNKYKLKSSKLEITKNSIDWDFDMVEADKLMFDEVFHGESYCPDQVKIYPFQVMDWTQLKDEHAKGLHISYGEIKGNPKDNELIKTLVDVKSRIPKYVRINRLKRDIPDSYSLGGITDSHGRTYIQKLMKELGLKCNCIRCNEISNRKIDPNLVELDVYKYKASASDEYFIHYKFEDKIIGFCRLRLDKKAGQFVDAKGRLKQLFEELNGCAMIRELHVYGEAIKVGAKNRARSQQSVGFGTKLVHHAINIARENGFKKISVIPGEGVKKYYERFGFVSNGSYMTLDIKENHNNLLIFLVIILCIYLVYKILNIIL